MSLTGSLYTTISGLQLASAKIATVSSNVTNADKVGYTRKEYQTEYVTAAGTTSPFGGMTVGSLDKGLMKSVVNDVSDAGYYNTLAEYMDAYSTALGSISTGQSLSSLLDDLNASISSLVSSPEDSSSKINLVYAAEAVTDELNNLSSTLQSQRLQADQAISQSVETINTSLDTLDSLNEQISDLASKGLSTADLEDERMVALETVAQQIDVSYFFNTENKLIIYTSSGQPLLDSQPHYVSHSAATSTTGAAEYPGGFDSITLNNVDITNNIHGGTLGALVNLRDESLVQEQEKLDAIADSLADTMNGILNDGTSYPPRDIVAGDTENLTASKAFNGTGNVRIAVTDQDGLVQSYADFDLSAYTDIGSLVTALDGLSGVQATLEGNGQLVLRSENAGEYLSFNQMDSSVGGAAESFGTYFGLSNLFTGEGAEYIRISEYLSTNTEYLTTSSLSSSATLNAGDRGISNGDGSIAENLADAMSGKVSFSAAGNFVAQNVTISSYTSSIISNAATRADTANGQSETAQLMYEQTKTTMENKTGVNIDEETANLTVLESHYQASALLISTIQDLFDSLIAAMR
jgi:flagellar hook-associated protein 1